MLGVQLERDERESSARTENSCHLDQRLGLVWCVLQGIDRHHGIGRTRRNRRRFEASMREFCTIAHADRQRTLYGALDGDARQITADHASAVLSRNPQAGTRRTASEIDKYLIWSQVQTLSDRAQFSQGDETDVGEFLGKVCAGHMLTPDSIPRRAATPRFIEGVVAVRERIVGGHWPTVERR